MVVARVADLAAEAEPAGRRDDPGGVRAGRSPPDRRDGGSGLGRRPRLDGEPRARSARPTPTGLRIFVAEAGDTVVSAGWIRFPSGTEFGTLWGGATLPEWRGRGIYRALVAPARRLAAERGCRYLEVDASDDSRPILERLGFVPVTTTTPYVWSPPAR